MFFYSNLCFYKICQQNFIIRIILCEQLIMVYDSIGPWNIKLYILDWLCLQSAFGQFSWICMELYKQFITMQKIKQHNVFLFQTLRCIICFMSGSLGNSDYTAFLGCWSYISWLPHKRTTIQWCSTVSFYNFEP